MRAMTLWKNLKPWGQKKQTEDRSRREPTGVRVDWGEGRDEERGEGVAYANLPSGAG